MKSLYVRLTFVDAAHKRTETELIFASPDLDSDFPLNGWIYPSISCFQSCIYPQSEVSLIPPVEHKISSWPIPKFPKFHLNVILSPVPRSSQWCLSSGPRNRNPVNTSPLPHACHMSLPPHPSNDIPLLSVKAFGVLFFCEGLFSS
jgi:hypothetical protein